MGRKKSGLMPLADLLTTIIYIRAVQEDQPNFIFIESDTVELERTPIPHGQLFQL